MEHPELAESLRSLAKMGAKFEGHYQGHHQDLGLFGAYNGITMDLDVGPVTARLGGQAIPLDHETTLELARFHQNEDNPFRLIEPNDLVPNGNTITAFEALRAPEVSFEEGFVEVGSVAVPLQD